MEIVEGHISKGIVDIRIPCKHNLHRGIYEFACQRIAVNESFCGDVSFFTTNMIKWLTVLLSEPIWIAVLQKKYVIFHQHKFLNEKKSNIFPSNKETFHGNYLKNKVFKDTSFKSLKQTLHQQEVLADSVDASWLLIEGLKCFPRHNLKWGLVTELPVQNKTIICLKKSTWWQIV